MPFASNAPMDVSRANRRLRERGVDDVSVGKTSCIGTLRGPNSMSLSEVSPGKSKGALMQLNLHNERLTVL